MGFLQISSLHSVSVLFSVSSRSTIVVVVGIRSVVVVVVDLGGAVFRVVVVVAAVVVADGAVEVVMFCIVGLEVNMLLVMVEFAELVVDRGVVMVV